ncbi:reverse transcriptase domain-containing protein [Tanacetum coccineum]
MPGQPTNVWWIKPSRNKLAGTRRVEERMFLGYKVNTKGIKVCPDKVEAVLNLASPKCLKDVQKVNRKLASLNRFLSKSAEKSLPKMKKSIEELPTLAAPAEKEELIVYLAAAREVVSAVLMTEREAKQMPIYFVSRALQDFIVERPEDDPLVMTTEAKEELSDPWTLFTDGSSYVDVEELNEKSINETELLAVVEKEGDTWMTPIYEYLTEETLLAKKEKARVVRRTSRWYTVINRILYKKSYLGPWLRDNPFKDWCEKLCICQRFASVKNPQANGLVERANRILGEGIKARLDERSNDWIEEIPHVLWAHHTMIKSSNGDTPFSLTYGTEAVIPAEIGMPTLRTTEIDMVQNDEALEINLDLLEERREQAAIREARSKAKMEKYYNSKVRNTSFKPGDLVYQNNDASHARDSRKLSPK